MNGIGLHQSLLTQAKVANATITGYTAGKIAGKIAAKEAKPDSFEKKESTGKKVAKGVGLAATIAGAIYLVKSGKGKEALKLIKKFGQEAKANGFKTAGKKAVSVVKQALVDFKPKADFLKNRVRESATKAGIDMQAVKDKLHNITKKGADKYHKISDSVMVNLTKGNNFMENKIAKF